MTVEILAIVFDHRHDGAGTYTVPLRYNGVIPVLAPEWRLGQTHPSAAAYRIDRLPAVAEVEVQLRASPDEPRLQEIRASAIPSQGDLPPPLTLVDALGSRLVGFDARGFSGPLRFSFDTSALRSGVALGTVDWLWQARSGGGLPWRDIAVTSHRFYSLISAPTAPWRIDGDGFLGAVFPRADMLDFACAWAYGATDVREVSDAVTRAVHALGGKTFRYDALVGAPHYTLLGAQLLLCDALVERLRGGLGTGPLVNCSDCATIVSTMANLVGADLWQSKMGLVGNGFPLNPLRGIGGSDWTRLYGAFAFHEVAWGGGASAEDQVWDACVELDGDGDPARAPHVPALATGQVFAGAENACYRDWITAKKGRDLCRPQPSMRVRRPVDADSVLPLPPLPSQTKDDVAGRLKIAEPLGEAPLDVMHFEGLTPHEDGLPGWRLTGGTAAQSSAPTPQFASPFGPTASVRHTVSRWTARADRRQAIRIETTETASSQAAKSLLLKMATQVEHPGLSVWNRGVPGELALRRSDGSFAMFTRGNLVCVGVSVGPRPTPVLDPLDSFDRWITTAGVAADLSVSPGRPAWIRWTFPQRLKGQAAANPLSLSPQARSAARRHIVSPGRSLD
jgi:hypothetical protein